MADNKYLFGDTDAKVYASPTNDALYHDKSQSPRARLIQAAFVAIVVIMALISVCLGIYRGVVIGQGLYFMLTISLTGLVAIEIIMVMFIRKGELPKGKFWFLYFVGGCIILESIFTNILLFH